jgi:hypothetical protein
MEVIAKLVNLAKVTATQHGARVRMRAHICHENKSKSDELLGGNRR